MLKPYIVYYKYKCPGDKKPGAIKQYRIYANHLEEARHLSVQHSNYPDIEIIKVKRA